MAALQKIRNKGSLLIIIVGIALLGFIAGDFFSSLDTTANLERMNVGKAFGEKLSYVEFQSLVDERLALYALQNNNESPSNENLNQIYDQVWNNFVSEKMFESELDKLGLRVTDEEIEAALAAGTTTSLKALASAVPFLSNQQGNFVLSQLQSFLMEYEQVRSGGTQGADASTMEIYERVYKAWTYTNREVRRELMAAKFQSLIQATYISNPIAAEMNFADRTSRATAEIFTVPYANIPDSSITVTDAELKAKYKELKESLPNMPRRADTKDIKFIDVAIRASEADHDSLMSKMQGFFAELSQTDDPETVVLRSQSLLNYPNILVSETAFTNYPDVAAALDSLPVGGIVQPYYNGTDNTMNVFKLIDKKELPDSIQYIVMGVPATSQKELQTRTDSIMKALDEGASIAELGAFYKSIGDTVWLSCSQQFEKYAYLLDRENLNFIRKILETPKGNYTLIESKQYGNTILMVLDRRDMKTKYNVAIIKQQLEFSDETSQTAVNNFNRFIADNRTIESIEANAAEAGYIIRTYNDVAPGVHNIAGISDTKDALTWVLDEAKTGDISQLYECGSATRDHLLLIYVTGEHKKGYEAWDSPEVREMLMPIIIKEKKAAQIMAKLGKISTSDGARSAEGVLKGTLPRVSFQASPRVSATATAEPILASLISAAEEGDFIPATAGDGGVYMAVVTTRDSTSLKLNLAQEMNTMARTVSTGIMSNIGNVLYEQGNVVDNRYKFKY